MAYTTSQGTALMKQYIEPKVTKTFQEEDNTFQYLMDTVPKQETNKRGKELPLQVTRNVGYGGLSGEGGLLPVPGNPTDIQAKVFYRDQFLQGEFSGEIRDQPDDAAIVKFKARLMKGDTMTFNFFQNFFLFGDGFGALGIVTIRDSGTQVTCNPDPTVANYSAYGNRFIFQNARVQFYNPATGLQRTQAGAITVSTVSGKNPTTGAVTLDAVPTDVAPGDQIVFENHYGKAPQGFTYHISDAGTDWLTVNRAIQTSVKAVVHDASASVTEGIIDLALLKTKNRMGTNVSEKDYVFVSHACQKTRYRNRGYALTRVVNASGNAKIDLGFPDATHNGIQWKEDNCSAPGDFWGLRLKTWAIEFIKLPGFYTYNTGDYVIQKPAAGNVYDAFLYAVYARYNPVCKDPRTCFRIKNLTFTTAEVETNV